MTSQEFAAQLKAKYPGYASIDDNKLVESVVQKYPQYKTQITDKSFLQDAIGDFKSIGTGILNSAQKSADKITALNKPLEVSNNIATKLTPTNGAGNRALQSVGALASAASGAIGSTLQGAANILLPESTEKNITTGIQKGVETAMSKDFAGGAIKSAVEFAQNWYNTLDEEQKNNIDAIGGIASLVGDFVGTEVIDTSAKPVIKSLKRGSTRTADAVVEGVGKAKDAIKTYPAELANKFSNTITKIDDQTKNVLNTASIEKFDRYVKAGEEALKNPRALTPLEQAGELVDNQILPAMKEDLSRIGAQKARTLDSISTTKIPGVAITASENLMTEIRKMKLTDVERKNVNQIVLELDKLGKNPTISSVDKTVDLLQNTLFEQTKGLSIPMTSRVESLINKAIGELDTAVKYTAQKTLKTDDYAVLNEAYARKIDMFKRLNKAIGEDNTKGGSLFKRLFSPQDAGTKKLFAGIAKEYGIDLAEDATLAKFVMESLGDTRAQSLLEQIPMSKSGLVTKVLQKVEKKLTRPIPKARGILKKKLISKE